MRLQTYQLRLALFQAMPQFSQRFYVTGESYAGHCISAVTSRIMGGRRGTFKSFGVMLVHNFYFLIRLQYTVLLFDDVFGGEKTGLTDAARSSLLFFILAAMILPYSIIRLFDFRMTRWEIGGTMRKTLQGNLLRTYLEYDEMARCMV